ncbi:MAG: glycoside hydrolase [Azospirillaceae bacterium]|nr:glycoside hydrolase [Azospirillaceae bacterium]
MRAVTLLVALLVAGLAQWLIWALPNRPYILAEPPGGKLQSVSFAPFRDGQSPLTRVYPSAAQIEEDIRVLANQVAGIRTYTSREGLEVVPAIAGKYGLTVTMGAWLGVKTALNDQEVASLIDLANRYPTVITRVIVGNEVLLRRDLSVDQLRAYIRKVKAAVKQPVSYADVWEWWLKYPEIAQDVDFITIHMLPYWEDIPTGVADVGPHILQVYHQIQTAFPGKPIMIGEAGWPTAGRSRGPAVPGMVNKARFINSFVTLAAQQGFDYNIIESFDQPWKHALEGTVGANWGLYTLDRTPKSTLGGAIVEDPAWQRHAGISVLIGLALFAGFALTSPLSAPGVVTLAFAAQGIAGCLVGAALSGWAESYTSAAAFGQAILWGLELLTGLAVLRTLSIILSRPPVAAATGGLRTLVTILSGLKRRRDRLSVTALGEGAMIGLVAYAVVAGVHIVLRGRYQDFPVPDYLIPAGGVLLVGLCRALTGTGGLTFDRLLSNGRQVPVSGGALSWRHTLCRVPVEAVLTVILLFTTVGTVISEGVANREALIWASLNLSLATPFLATVWRVRRGGRTEAVATPPGVREATL